MSDAIVLPTLVRFRVLVGFVSRNMNKKEVPHFHCMADQKGRLATPPWSKTEYMVDEMSKKVRGHLVLEYTGRLMRNLSFI